MYDIIEATKSEDNPLHCKCGATFNEIKAFNDHIEKENVGEGANSICRKISKNNLYKSPLCLLINGKKPFTTPTPCKAFQHIVDAHPENIWYGCQLPLYGVASSMMNTVMKTIDAYKQCSYQKTKSSFAKSIKVIQQTYLNLKHREILPNEKTVICKDYPDTQTSNHDDEADEKQQDTLIENPQSKDKEQAG